MQVLNVCAQCSLKHHQPPQVQVLPEYICSYCEKSESQILYLGQPSCLKCQTKLSINLSVKLSTPVSSNTQRQSQHGCSPFSPSFSPSTLNNSDINRTIVKGGGETKIMKKVSEVLAGFTFSKGSLAKLKHLQFYWSRSNNKTFSWADFIDSVEHKSPLALILQVRERIFGVFISEHIEKKKATIEDKHCGCFEITNSGSSVISNGSMANEVEFSHLEKNRFVVRYEKHIICFGSPGSIHLIFDAMEVESEYLGDGLSHQIDQFVAIRL